MSPEEKIDFNFWLATEATEEEVEMSFEDQLECYILFLSSIVERACDYLIALDEHKKTLDKKLEELN